MSGTRRPRRPRRLSRGIYLLEALVALVVLSIGLLGVLGLMAAAVRASGGATWRSEGFDIAADTLARMAAEAPGSMAALYDDTSQAATGYRALLAQAMRLPGVTDEANAPEVFIDDSGETRRLRVVVRWQPPGERLHQASIRAALPRP